MARPGASQGAGGAVARLLQWFAVASLIVAVAATPAGAADLREYAVAVIDAKTGQIMHSRAADATRYPASIAKVMTLYVLFQELDSGRMTLSTPLSVSSRAAAAQPSKLYLQAGSTITVEQAILAVVTKSANDVARVIAEGISGTESEFAERMTVTAHALGMTRTTYRNASGLPDSGQVTTVRDQARLGIAISQHFAEYYRYFQTRSFRYRGQTYGNHNRLLGVNGIDGIKTGYIRASGFNLLTAARSNNRHIVIAAFGFESAAARDSRVRELVNRYLPEASQGETRQAALIARPGGGGSTVANPVRVAMAGTPPPRPAHLMPASPPPPVAPGDQSDVLLASYEPEASLPPDRPGTEVLVEEPLALMPVETSAPERDTFTPANVLGNFILQVFGGDAGSAEPTPTGLVPPGDVGGPRITGSAGEPVAVSAPAGAWAVQVGAAPNEDGAYQLLTQAGANLAELSDYRSYVQHITRDGQSFYRARFVGFADRTEASTMCEALKQKQINCLAMPG
ncbi:MAG: D-alanyl-D-alanine carboxypeptidase [Cucumibacter sp.]